MTNLHYFLTFLTFFILGEITFFIFPRDVTIQVPDSAPRVTNGSLLVANDGGCKIFEDYLRVDGEIITGAQKVVCR